MRVLGVIPARGGSKGLPGKNIKPLAGRPLLAHSIACAGLTKRLTRTIVTSDDEPILRVAKACGGDVPFVRPAELARDDTPMMPVLQHAMQTVERLESSTYDALALLDPTSPGRLPEEIDRAVEMLEREPTADGVVAVSEPLFNPLWVGVFVRDGTLLPAFEHESSFARRQDVPRFFRINGAFYLWRRDFLLGAGPDWVKRGKHLPLEMAEERAFSIDTAFEFQVAELLVKNGLISLPWV
jgi:N-acylneuraminate cytidylyltransferase